MSLYVNSPSRIARSTSVELIECFLRRGAVANVRSAAQCACRCSVVHVSPDGVGAALRELAGEPEWSQAQRRALLLAAEHGERGVPKRDLTAGQQSECLCVRTCDCVLCKSGHPEEYLVCLRGRGVRAHLVCVWVWVCV